MYSNCYLVKFVSRQGTLIKLIITCHYRLWGNCDNVYEHTYQLYTIVDRLQSDWSVANIHSAITSD